MNIEQKVKRLEDILIIAPYPELAKDAMQLREKTDIPFSLISGDPKNPWQQQINPATRVIISRGGMAKSLRKMQELPVIDVPVTPADILKSISAVARSGYKKIAIITPANILSKPSRVMELSDQLQLIFVTDADGSIENVVKRLIEDEKVEAIIGDRVSAQIALQHHVHSHLLKSSEESVLTALDTATNVLRAQTSERTKTKEMQSILDVIHEAVLTIDPDGIIKVYNDAAKRIFGFPQDIAGRKYSDCFTDPVLLNVIEEKKEERQMLHTLANGKKIVIHHIPIYIDSIFQGSVGIYQEISKIQNMELNIRKRLNDRGLTAKNTFDDFVTTNTEMKQVVTEARSYAQSEATILVYGETGTGKELFAQSIHNASKRNKGPFVSVNCAALSENLLESELFGYVEGAFTGAIKGGRPGLFELAHGGSLFLDEIGEISLPFQAKLLRVLQEKEVRRIGGDRIIPIDVRVICATNKPLFDLTQEGLFREDLYYRLSVLELSLIPLRDRKEDIIPLAISFLKAEMQRENRVLVWENTDVFLPLIDHQWLGNARELQNAIHRLVICTPEGTITQDLVSQIIQSIKKKQKTAQKLEVEISTDFRKMETDIWRKLLNQYDGNKERLCEVYNISKTTLWRKLLIDNNEQIGE
ncbi:sigma 54-interacting transcriptional regulator [Domibacillus sp. DTU_2020_1001157_1_SI_ALB_TIR_016]|uniref:sigma 54-interacting transcriptional regulator n=1 Tax=Domibacillus sp. DTU_2020_1001157_1_SI_ALB_TIR_016 TaxID=3077789 RepID=UPI0028E225D3|nr:sigma 54-interacting transcriptional regulator [Domibacillus sp. DTU_2020_1001157_1_SI_ALB_TIR_016]WNS78698.1 sigma 54-interacting transcriptional regulator [Domibacillus sp. DTU_2020_1001157_1_SI_ALB_TIR_016]